MPKDVDGRMVTFHPSYIQPIESASEKAKALTKKLIDTVEEFQGMSDSRTKADAFRHAIWNVLICKYVGEDKRKISDCVKIADDFTTRHETGANQPSYMTDEEWELDKCMDLHNNKQGRNYFESVATIIKVGFLR